VRSDVMYFNTVDSLRRRRVASARTLTTFSFPRDQMLEPRRLAAKAAARRLAALLGTRVGDKVGYRVRHEAKVSRETRIEVGCKWLFSRRQCFACAF